MGTGRVKTGDERARTMEVLGREVIAKFMKPARARGRAKNEHISRPSARHALRAVFNTPNALPSIH